MDPIRRLCESHQFHFVVFLQHSAEPRQRFWTTSKPLRTLFGNLIFESATFVDTDGHGGGGGGGEGDVSGGGVWQEAADEVFAAADELKMEVEDGESLAAAVAAAAFETVADAAADAVVAGMTTADDDGAQRANEDDHVDESVLLLPAEELEEDAERGGGNDRWEEELERLEEKLGANSEDADDPWCETGDRKGVDVGVDDDEDAGEEETGTIQEQNKDRKRPKKKTRITRYVFRAI